MPLVSSALCGVGIVMGKELNEFSVEEVGVWLRRNNLRQLEARFCECGIDGAALCQLTWESLRQEVGITQSSLRQQVLRRVEEARTGRPRYL